MAPRGRPAKKVTRMDAALDAMTPYGFGNKLVRQTVSQLLKVYGGNDGWVFIEDSAYTLLIETLLEKQQQEMVPLPQDSLTEDNPGNDPNEASLAGCSNRALQPCSKTEDSNDAAQPTNQATGTISEASESSNQLPVMVVNKESGKHCSIKPAAAVSATVENGSKVPIKVVDNVLAESSQTKSSQPMGRLCHKRRKPCYGWISCDEEEEEELMELPPGPLANALHKLGNDKVSYS